MSGLYDGVQQPVYFAPADTESLLRRLRETYNFRMSVGDNVDANGPRWNDSIDALVGQVRLGFSTEGFMTPRLWLQFEPYLTVPVEYIEGRYSRYNGRFPRGGCVEFSTGGIYEKTGELVSGRVAFTLWLQMDGKVVNFRDRAWGYEEIMNTAKCLGAKHYKSYLIGKAAWDLFKKGTILIQVSGTKSYLK